MTFARDFLIVALDYPSASSALSCVETLGEAVNFYKVGMQLFYAAGPSILQDLRKRKKKIFLDLKLNDIPMTVSQAVLSLQKYEPEYLTLFTDEPQLKKATENTQLNQNLKILNVTVLTSDTAIREQVLQRALLSKRGGAKGVICSGQETALVREKCGKDFIIINPGIRPAGYSAKDDQTRIVTPRMAYEAGANHIVVGRPITRADNPAEVVEQILSGD